MILIRCFKCPTSYHINCIPPDARYHELALLCEAHPEVRGRVARFREFSRKFACERYFVKSLLLRNYILVKSSFRVFPWKLASEKVRENLIVKKKADIYLIETLFSP